ncbi:hypothetical protein F444_20093 [Phytophthora nicotianae P1976]|uniref:DDE-1 domain-containing protein n=1 Tax=Phytophthora nicotianae P1976 TaxID=1317066 RepID=A0A080Z5P7_PHYNI|nr:hypothetical protein F444_20093 [Phytophthora nicotianae P1976]
MIRFAERVKSNAPFHLMWDEFSNHWTAEIPTCVKEVEVILLTAPGDYTCGTNDRLIFNGSLDNFKASK